MKEEMKNIGENEFLSELTCVWTKTVLTSRRSMSVKQIRGILFIKEPFKRWKIDE